MSLCFIEEFTLMIWISFPHLQHEQNVIDGNVTRINVITNTVPDFIKARVRCSIVLLMVIILEIIIILFISTRKIVTAGIDDNICFVTFFCSSNRAEDRVGSCERWFVFQKAVVELG